MKLICYVTAALCGFLGIASIAELAGFVSLNLDLRTLTIGILGTCMGIYLAGRIDKIEGRDDQRGGPSIRQ